MFRVHASYCSLLSVVCRRVSDVSVGYLTEVVEDGSVVYGVEIDISNHLGALTSGVRIFWDCSVLGCLEKFECASLQAVIFLQRIYGFIVVDYGYYGMLAYRTLGSVAANLAAEVIGCCRDAASCGDLSAPARASLCATIRLIEDRVDSLAQLFYTAG